LEADGELEVQYGGFAQAFQARIAVFNRKCKEQKPYNIKHDLTIVEAHNHLQEFMA
jgi:hypothetical protein